MRECEYVSLSTSGQCPSLSSDASMLAASNDDYVPVIPNSECSNEEKSFDSDWYARTTHATSLTSNMDYNCDNFSNEIT